MNKDKKIFIAKNIARKILLALREVNCFDAVVTRYFTSIKCINYLQKNMYEYFRKNDILVSWNKNTYLDIFDDQYLIDALVFYMTNFNLDKEIENEQST